MLEDGSGNGLPVQPPVTPAWTDLTPGLRPKAALELPELLGLSGRNRGVHLGHHEVRSSTGSHRLPAPRRHPGDAFVVAGVGQKNRVLRFWCLRLLSALAVRLVHRFVAGRSQQVDRRGQQTRTHDRFQTGPDSRFGV
jgi:hypothetical protein